MRVLRSTLYPPPGVGAPMTTVMRDSDLAVPLDEAADIQRTSTPLMFVATETFAMPDGSIQRATEEANGRWQDRRQREENMALMFYWYAMEIKKQKRPGVPLHIKGTKGAPLSVDEIVYALAQLAEHPWYSPDVRIETYSIGNGTAVALDGGAVSIGAPPPVGVRGRYHGAN